VYHRDVEMFERHFRGAMGARVVELLVPVTLGELHEEGWRVVMPTVEIVAYLVNLILVGRRTLSVERLEHVLGDEDRAVELLNRTLDHAVDPLELVQYRPSGGLGTIRLTDAGVEERWLYRYDLGGGEVSWFMAPGNILGSDPAALLMEIAPGVVGTMRRIADVLEIPVEIPG